MADLHQEHIEITNQVKQAIHNVPIVFPAQYGKLYYEASQSRDIHLKPDELLTYEMLDEKIVRHIITLSECADHAITAIETEDKSLLTSILEKTKQLQQEIQELQKIVYEDGLTKSYNRKWFDDTILTQDKLSLRDSGTIVMIDLNKFKEINDTYGHLVGDKVLIHVTAKLKESGGRVVRYGGDEFIVVFDAKVSTSDIKAKIENILRYFEKIHFKVEDKSFKVSFAYGMAPFTRGADVLHVVEAADKSMYRHKKGA
ncbi:MULTISPECIES: GGDEF domain-containing protein [unclassified Sulfuricurvum]|uniref:GGDEF domain-containing protein n=1 Tax=unclassified Sulfuricurvum TaxID=2632390 RepID=UPI0002996107|nr:MULTISPECIES: GGDEF domain-containing protein [unclassified Sulfuricurvum]AFV97746.1 diguanylate cyclase [Candidatus Sulfuricurvum sp. RIFRC-1]OHD88229.1 MAG: hypothetical protein A2W83_03980 [Sulfuricurvum sp. RIFCSPLOWO2_12_43_5]OHD90819.1 MAG: hypothetical protein A3G19_00510 [Sulfuricurvum sp. RIFCSPLOWO2_12_FULL_43_24]HBM36450.1 GGDEF domain-containing protein [Sulfuricurvum sp.]